jgi:FAD/FMN-containing dehydrogenase
MAERELAKIVGSKNVLSGVRALREYSQDLSFVPRVRPRCVVKPANTDEVQAIVKWANETHTPLVPVSSGPPHFRGDTIPSFGGTVIVDLSKMKKIVRIDPRNRVALVEPGVTFSELIPRLEQEGLRPNMPLLPRRSKSVAASVLEREPVIMPKYHWDGSDPLACTEVIYGTGDMFRTGSASGPGDLDYQWSTGAAQVSSGGPTQADFHRLLQGSQGTMGIVTWVTVRCERMPRLEEPFLVGSPELDRLLELAHWFIRRRLVNECLVINNSNLAHMLANRGKELEAIKDALPQWVLFFCIAGYEYFPEERIDYQIEAVTDITSRAGLEAVKNIGETSAFELLRLLRKCSAEPYWKLRDKGSCHDIFFITNRDNLSCLITIMNESAQQHGYPISDMGAYIQPVVQGTSCHCEFNLFFDPNNSKQVDRVKRLSTSAAEVLSAGGAFFSRPYGSWADIAYRKDLETTTGLRKVKGIFDPNNIMNPGKLCF